MQFKYPEILYALILLIIPIIVHLFQLQRFVKIPFTNVNFLKNIEQQTRKSSRLKKWLILLSRMLAFSCLILAFSQPYFSNYSVKQNFDISIYLDNSFSMQAKGGNGELLKSAAQNIIEQATNKNSKITLLTNSNHFNNLNENNLKKELININYTPTIKSLNTVYLQLTSQQSKKINTSHKNILISDFQNINVKNKNVFTNVNTPISLLKLEPSNQNNIFIDSVFTTNKSNSEIIVHVIVKSVKKNNLNIPISLFNNTKLVGKATVKFDNSKVQTLKFNIPYTENFKGRFSLNDPVLEFDNSFYFTITNPLKINVLSIGKTTDFLNKIYTKSEFNFTATPLQNLSYNNIQNQDLIILNELENIPNELADVLIKFSTNGGSIVIIPASNISIISYNQFFSLLQIGSIQQKIEGDQKATSINYEHPLINDVFEKKVTNFQYPTSSIFYSTQLINNNPVLKFNNNIDYISSIKKENNNIYWISAPINKKVSNLFQSSLIVPIFYNFAKKSLKTSKLYYTIKPSIEFDIKTSIGKDDVLTITNGTSNFIPLQTISKNKVTIHLENHSLNSGFYTISDNLNELQTIAFNYNRLESDLDYIELESIIKKNKNISISSSIDEVFKKINNEQEINWLFKWFLAFSALFLLIEMLLLKYFNI